jgi:uncharacterized repeat protein (TIGR01451 family)
MFVPQRAIVGTGALSVITLAVALVLAPYAAAQSDRAVKNDPRAEFVERNATECAHLERDGVINLPEDVVQLTGDGAGQDESAGDRFVTGTVTANVQTPFGLAPRALQVEITPAGVRRDVVIRAVVVKGGNGYNAYVNPDFLPPALQPDQDYIPPWVGQNNIADISHWFLCYTLGPPRHDSLRVTKRIEPPVGEPVDPLPSEYRVHVTCTEDGTVVKERTFTFGAGGGSGTTETGATEMIVPDGARCRVQERNIDALPDGCEVHYEPQLANYPGVIVPDDGREVEVVNDCQDARVRRARLDIVKRIVGFAPGELPDSFQFDVGCTDGTDAEVTVPASGEPGTPRLDDIRVGEYCLVTERTGSLPPGLQISYDINGSPSPVAGAAAFQVVDERITVTVTNTASSSPPGSPPPEVPGEPRPEMDPEKTVRRALVRGGGRVRYRIEVHNRGSGVARRVVVCDRLPRAMTLVSAPGSRFRNGRICWRIARLRPLGRRLFTLTARANRRASDRTTNVVTADAPRAAVRTARARVIIRPRRGLSPGAVTG